MSLIVQKFGGTSVADSGRLRHVAQIITDTYKAGNQVVAVLSAQGDTTDELIEKAREINPGASTREMDMLLSTGEQISVALCAMAVEALGFPVVSLTGWQAGMVTNTVSMNARIKKVDTERIEAELDARRIVIVTGFQGINRYDDVTTLGRGGSDTSAVALAASLHADLCQIYTDVDGVYTADPRLVPHARKLDEVTYNEMLELATLGAQVLHNRSVEMAKKYNVSLEVLSSFSGNPGTKVKEVAKRMEKSYISSVAKDTNIARIALLGVPNEIGTSFKVFSLLAQHNINVDIILQGIGHEEGKDICFTVAQSDLAMAEKLLRENQERIRFRVLETNADVAKVSVVGAGVIGNPGVAAKLFEALYDAGININMISTSEIKISVLVERRDAEKAVQVIHDKFFAI
ncbi:aspartate kinase [Clostridium sp. AF18-27]|mgnify:FL=1|uniref:Aspartokinase n=1 Tax=Enterocloster lavalensis TaxID=460384 RepID=A0A1I0DJA2_9FIRM|nr:MULTISPECIES: aspartate kinase [Enterocloster]MBS5605595.1 aspartate kinase [Enterocloster asparagiformis]RHR49704.1 aspartate kinase [Clostridium sp. AF18-27]MCB6344637.1 aspartate kinase [Enterocloster lavalensis]MDR3755649.1 aspartate kinase [Enterocloster sp.]PST35134.1 aspartate kinase [Enterocloster lavalensis]